MEKVRIGLIGCGGRSNSHRQSFLKMNDVQVVAVADPIEERRMAAAQQFGVSRIYKDYDELYEHESKDTLDAVVICIEPTAHSSSETHAIDLGLHFLVEKPVTMDIEQARDIARRVKEKGIITSVGFQDRYLKLTDMIREELKKHKKGGLVYGAWIGGIPGVWWWQKKSTCGGQLVEQNIHLADELRYLFGEPLSVYATSSVGIVEPGINASAEYDTDDHSTAVIRFPNNVTATLVSACYSRSGRPHSGLVITLEDMVIDYRLRNNLIFETAEYTYDVKREPIDHTFYLDEAFIHAVKTGDTSLIRSDYEDALKTHELVFAANRSMESGQVIYFDK